MSNFQTTYKVRLQKKKKLVCVFFLVFSCAKKRVSFLACDIRYIQYFLYVIYRANNGLYFISQRTLRCPHVYVVSWIDG